MTKRKTFRRVKVAGHGYTLGRRKQIFGGKAVPSNSQALGILQKKELPGTTDAEQLEGVEQGLPATVSASIITQDHGGLQDEILQS